MCCHMQSRNSVSKAILYWYQPFSIKTQVLHQGCFLLSLLPNAMELNHGYLCIFIFAPFQPALMPNFFVVFPWNNFQAEVMLCFCFLHQYLHRQERIFWFCHPFKKVFFYSSKAITGIFSDGFFFIGNIFCEPVVVWLYQIAVLRWSDTIICVSFDFEFPPQDVNANKTGINKSVLNNILHQFYFN